MRKAWLLLTVLGLTMLILALFLWPMLGRWYDVAAETAIRSGPDSDIDSLLSASRTYAICNWIIFTVCIGGGSTLAMYGVWGYKRSRNASSRQNMDYCRKGAEGMKWVGNMKIAVWIPFAFCSVIIAMAILTPGDQVPFHPVFAFLPMCFFFAAVDMMKMQKQIDRLKSELESKGKGTDAQPPDGSDAATPSGGDASETE